MTVDEAPDAVDEHRVPRVLPLTASELHTGLVFGTFRIASDYHTVQTRVAAEHLRSKGIVTL